MLGRIRRATRFMRDAEAAQTSAPRRPQRSIARDAVLALLALDDGRSRLGADYVVAAALMGELVQERRLTVSGEGRKTRVDVCDRTPTGDPDLDDALLTIVAPPRDWVDKREVRAARARVQEIFERLPDQELAVVATVIHARAASRSD